VQMNLQAMIQFLGRASQCHGAGARSMQLTLKMSALCRLLAWGQRRTQTLTSTQRAATASVGPCCSLPARHQGPTGTG
jgi:hypothetical protein